MKDSHKIVLSSVIAGISLWIIDGIIDTYIFLSRPFLDALIFNIPAHELYMRIFLTGSFIAFGAFTAAMVARKKKLEEQIFQAKIDWEGSFDSISDAITIHDKDFNVIRANKSAEKMLGLPFSDIINKKKCYELFHGKNDAPEKCPCREVLKTGKSGVLEIFEPYLNRFIEIRAMPRYNKDNQLIGLIHAVRDITDRKRVEKALIKSEERYRTFINSMTDLSFLKDENFRYLIINKAFTDFLGKKEEEILGKTAFELMPESAAESCSQSDIKALKSAGIVVSQEFLGERICETRKFRVELGNGKYGIGAYIRDITEQNFKEVELKKHRKSLMKLVEEQTSDLQRTNERLVKEINEHKQANERETGLLRELRTLFENFPLGILYLDNKYNVIAMNNFLTELTGLREEELKGRPCYETLGEYADDPAKKGHEQICSFCKKDECFKNKRPTVIERPFKNKFVRVTTVPELDENGDVSRFLEIVEDITDRKLAEAEAIRSSHLASLGELAAGVAHEVNNPINGIINYAQMLQNKYAPDSRDYTIANRIIKESDRISGIVRKLLSFARDRKEEKSLTDISAVLSDALDLGGAQMKNDGIILNVNMQEALPEINANPQQIEQVFLNILSNARYALSQKYPGTHKDKALEITGEKVMVDERCYARITFYDRGTGISSGIIDKVMNPFFSTKPGNQGTGLGLSISHGIISDHGGKVMIDSVEGEYTKIIVDLPVAKQ